MAVKLRKRVNKDNTTTLFLDIYHNGKRRYEFLQFKLLNKPSNPKEKSDNKEYMKLAMEIVSQKLLNLESDNYDIAPKHRQSIEFSEFFKQFKDKYKKKDLRVLEACYNQFIAFLKEEGIKELSAKQLTSSKVEDFKDYLIHKLNGESPANYLKKFKMVVKRAMKENYILKNPCEGISIKVGNRIEKHILTPDEIELLASTPMTNESIKNAFFFSLYTGLRFSDIIAIKWKNIDFTNNQLNFKQEKTGHSVTLNLHPTALMVLDKIKKKEGYVFNLPSHTACSKGLKVWVKKAGIDKHITWHCARHSFATNLIFFGADINTTSSLLGHSNFRYTERYTHIVASLKSTAISKLPESKF